MAVILVVDDDHSIAAAFDRFLRHEGHTCLFASNAEDALERVEAHRPGLVFMDVRMPGADGLQALKTVRASYPDVYVVIMTAYGTSQTSIDAIRGGAFEYVMKPLDLNQLRAVITHALSARSTVSVSAQESRPRVALAGHSSAMQEVFKLTGRLAATHVPALVIGEWGTGKELIVRTVHDNSSRQHQPFRTVDCANATPETIEDALSSAQGGTLHLATVHALSRAAQASVTHMLTSRPARSGSSPLRPRVMASTDADLKAAVDAGTFSVELYELLRVITVQLQPLRNRPEDIPALVAHFVQRFNDELSLNIIGVDDSTMRRLADHSWLGNAAELETVLKRACIVARGEVITRADLGDSLTAGEALVRQRAESALAHWARITLTQRLGSDAPDGDLSPYREIVGIVEGALVTQALAITNGNQVRAADLLGVNRATLRKKAAVT